VQRQILLSDSARTPLWSATLPWWWGFALMTQKISKICRWGAN